MNTSYANDFTYCGFSVSRYNLIDYIANLEPRSAVSKWGRQRNRYYSTGIVESMIHAMAVGNVQFNVRDRELCTLLEQMIVKGGYNADGVYSDEAHAAIRRLYQMQGKNPDECALYDKNISGRFGKAKSKLKSIFGFGKKAPQDSSRTAEAATPAQPAPVPNSQPRAQQSGDATSPAPQPQAKSKKRWVPFAAITTGVITMVAVMFSGAGRHAANQDGNSSQAVPEFKTVNVGDTAHNITQVYNLSDGVYGGIGIRPFAGAQQSVAQPRDSAVNTVATDSASVQLTRTSKSALNILLGEKKADTLCHQVQSQMDAGIFTAPRGMSAERIAHAMTMSRIYEGKSVILDALNSNVALTPAQQAAFNQHIDEIGDMGVGIQKRMASKHKLSTHSKYDHASRTQQKVHIKNLKQLKQFRKMARTR